MKFIKTTIYIALSLFLIYKALTWVVDALKPDYWMGVYYQPNNEWIYSSKFRTKEECASWAQGITRDNPQHLTQNVGWLWECNKNCKLSDEYRYLLENSPEYISKYSLSPTYICDEGGFDDGDWGR